MLALSIASSIVAVVAPRAVAQTPPALTLDVVNEAFSPNGDGVLDATIAVVEVAAPATLTLEVRSASGEHVRTVVADRPI